MNKKTKQKELWRYYCEYTYRCSNGWEYKEKTKDGVVLSESNSIGLECFMENIVDGDTQWYRGFYEKVDYEFYNNKFEWTQYYDLNETLKRIISEATDGLRDSFYKCYMEEYYIEFEFRTKDSKGEFKEIQFFMYKE